MEADLRMETGTVGRTPDNLAEEEISSVSRRPIPQHRQSRMVQGKKSEAANGQNKRDSSTMSYQKQEVRNMGGKNQNGFRTDSSISSGHQVGQRTLQPWSAGGGGDSDTFGSLGALENKASGSGEKWDQFSTNEKLFGLKTDYDENMYTTQIDKSHPKYKERMAAAERKAREIERSAAATSHVAEERIMDYVGGNDRGGDEEDNGVKRQDFPPLPGGSRDKKYTPPAMRAPTNNSTVKGAPVDPAIISARIGTQKPQQSPTKVDEPKARTESPAAGTSANAVPSAKTPEPKADAAKPETHSKTTEKPLEVKPVNQSATPLKASAATSRTISPQGKEGAAVPNATSTVERDVLSSFKTFANKERMTAEKIRSNKAKADKEVKLHELKKFATNFKLPTPVPVDLISIIAKDPAKQREIQEKASRDAAEVAQRRKVEEQAAKDKKPTTTKEGQPTAAPQGAAQPQAERVRPVSTVVNGPQAIPAVPKRPTGPPHMQQQGGRQPGTLAQRIRNVEQHKLAEMRQPPTGPSHPNEPLYGRRPMPGPGQMGKLNPNSHEFRPNAFAPAFSPNGHPSAGSSPRSALNNPTEGQSTPASSAAVVVVVSKKRKAVDPKKCVILAHIKAQPVPQGKNYDDNDGIKPSFDTAPTWRQAQEEEKGESTMRLSYTEYFERQPFAAQPTPNPTHVMPQMAHQHQLPFHLQHGAHNVPPRPSPHQHPVQMHQGQHGPVPHVPYNGADDHRMMPSNSSHSYSSPRMAPVPMAYPPNMNNPQMPYGQPGFAPGTPQMQFNRSFSNNPQYMPQQQMPMGGPMMPQFMNPQGMPAPQMQMYPSGGFMPPGVGVPQPMPGANGYPSPGRPAAAPMMAHQGSQQGQPIYGMSPGMQYQQPVFPQQPGQMNNMRGYSNPSPQQFGTSPSQMHQYTPQQHRNGNNYNKNYQGPNQHQGPQGGHAIPTGPQGRAADGPDEAK
ncbi:hypothetical protein PG995_014869 [Apiospora arundinis]